MPISCLLIQHKNPFSCQGETTFQFLRFLKTFGVHDPKHTLRSIKVPLVGLLYRSIFLSLVIVTYMIIMINIGFKILFQLIIM